MYVQCVYVCVCAGRCVPPTVTSRSTHSLSDPAVVYGTAAFHAAVFIVGNAVHVVMYYFDFQGLRKYKVEKKDWPWQRGEQNRRDFFALVRKAVGIILFNQLCIGLPLAALSFPNMVSKGWKGDQESIPGALTMVLQVAFCIVAEDFLFCACASCGRTSLPRSPFTFDRPVFFFSFECPDWAHRSLHIRAIYPYVHRFHHKFNNKESTVGVASEAAHPIEFVFANLIPTMAGPTLLGVHQATLFCKPVLLCVCVARLPVTCAPACAGQCGCWCALAKPSTATAGTTSRGCRTASCRSPAAPPTTFSTTPRTGATLGRFS